MFIKYSVWSPWTVTKSLIFDQQFFSPKSYLTAGYNIVPNYLLTDTIFRRNIFLLTNCVFWFSLQIFYEIFFIARKVERKLITKHPQVFISKSRFSCQIYAKLEFSWHVQKYSSAKFCEIPSTRSDGQTDMTKLIVVFRNLTHLKRSHFCPFLSQHRKCQ